MGAIVASYIHHAPRSLAGAQDYVNGLHAALAVSAAISFAAAIVAVAHRAHAAGGRARAHGGDGRVTSTTARMPAAERPRAHLVETAIRVFTEGSYRGTTTAEIARAAGVSEPILYRHFASKRDLYLAALEHVWDTTRTALGAEAGGRCGRLRRGRGDRQGSRLRPLAEAPARRAVGAGAERGIGGPRAPAAAAPAHARGARLRRLARAAGPGAGCHLAERDPDAEAWIMLAGGILGMVGRRVGLLDDRELEAIRPRASPGSGIARGCCAARS